ncbi:MAG: N-acetyl-alpha-D-glucosaminyl L-malate synthase BshA [Calditrichaeota bacterium]|nr:N-acetyl-alpha-D-glucosaminyl L-malate synthase BshA [Calditrichota bacterium]MCB9369464.1 N-acetyl-alpha-D-glucosaminyl L-malate synthase BshA [Calditrichota bacterium]
MRIGIILYPTYGGSGVVATELGVALAMRGHEVHFFSTARPFRLPAFQENTYFHEVPVVGYDLFENTPYTLTLSSTLFDAFKMYKLDVLHAHYAIPHATAAYLAREMNGGLPPVITTLHGTDITLVGSHPAYAPVVKFTLEQSNAITAVSEFLAEETRESLNCQKEIRVIYNFIDTELYKRDKCVQRRDWLAAQDEPIVLHISNFRPVKRIPDIIDAFAKVRQNVKSKLVLVGDGPIRSSAELQVRELGLQGEVRFLGKQTGLIDLLSVGDVYVLPSNRESFGLSALEAMSCEMPVVGYDVGGLPEVVTKGKTGFLHQVGDVDGLAASILQLVKDENLRRKMGQAGRRRCEEVFHIDTILPQYEQLYLDTLRETEAQCLNKACLPSSSSKSVIT